MRASPSGEVRAMLEIVRLVTLHPALVHVTVGVVPLLVLAYAVAWRRRSPAWTFVGDSAVLFTAGVSLLTLSSGLLSNALVPWPGGLGTWRWLHLGFGITSTVLLITFAAARAVVRRRAPSAASGGRSLGAAAFVAAVVGATGWIGGEVLVFHSGVAVKAAADGALAPPLERASSEPADLHDSMRRLRASWAGITTSLAGMVVEEPRASDYEGLARDARSIERVASWVSSREAEGAHGAGGPMLAVMARTLEEQARTLADAAAARDLLGVSRAAGEITTTCAGCHDAMRWEASPPGEASPALGVLP